MRTRFLVAWLVLFPLVLRAQLPQPDSAAIARVTQELFDAITYGDSAVWAPYLAARWHVTDEEGNVIARDEFLRTLHGLPAGQSGSLKVTELQLERTDAVAITTYAADEQHNYYGQHLTTRFRATDTWVRQSDGWRQLASQVTALPTPIPGRRVPRQVLEPYAGEYTLTPDISLTIVVSDSGLELVRRSRPAERLYALDERIFIRHGVRGFWLFERDAAGTVARLVNWRDNNPVVWTRRRP